MVKYLLGHMFKITDGLNKLDGRDCVIDIILDLILYHHVGNTETLNRSSNKNMLILLQILS